MNLAPFITTFLIVGIAELGDKTQLLVLGFASKFPMEKVIYGVVCATASLMLLAVLVGAAIHRVLPPIFISILAGAFFIIYGMVMIKPAWEGKKEEDKEISAKDPFWIVFGSLFIAELGDKTQLATFALAAKYSSPVLVWMGATLGMIVANLFGIVIGNILRNYLPERVITVISGVIFIVFGLVTFLNVIRF